VAAIGLGVNETAACERLLAELDPDLFLLAGRYTLLEQAPLGGLLPACERRGVGVVVGGPFNSGVLARPDGTFNYVAVPPDVMERVARLRAVCARFGVPLPAAALQLAAAHPAVVSVIPGGQTPGEVAANAEMMAAPIPTALWAELKDEGLIVAAAPTPVMETV
jgi:D-threo-aldose 1-dehydrogenase